MKLVDVISDADVLCAYEPDELGLRMLPVLAQWNRSYDPLTLSSFVRVVHGTLQAPGGYPPSRQAEIEFAIREAWAWLEGVALLIEGPGYQQPNSVRVLSRRARQLAHEPNAPRVLGARRIPKDSLHPTIQEDVWSLYHVRNTTPPFLKR